MSRRCGAVTASSLTSERRRSVRGVAFATTGNADDASIESADSSMSMDAAPAWPPDLQDPSVPTEDTEDTEDDRGDSTADGGMSIAEAGDNSVSGAGALEELSALGDVTLEHDAAL